MIIVCSGEHCLPLASHCLWVVVGEGDSSIHPCIHPSVPPSLCPSIPPSLHPSYPGAGSYGFTLALAMASEGWTMAPSWQAVVTVAFAQLNGSSWKVLKWDTQRHHPSVSHPWGIQQGTAAAVNQRGDFVFHSGGEDGPPYKTVTWSSPSSLAVLTLESHACIACHYVSPTCMGYPTALKRSVFVF